MKPLQVDVARVSPGDASRKRSLGRFIAPFWLSSLVWFRLVSLSSILYASSSFRIIYTVGYSLCIFCVKLSNPLVCRHVARTYCPSLVLFSALFYDAQDST